VGMLCIPRRPRGLYFTYTTAVSNFMDYGLYKSTCSLKIVTAGLSANLTT
jgi:hypothetical protein